MKRTTTKLAVWEIQLEESCLQNICDGILDWSLDSDLLCAHFSELAQKLTFRARA